MPQQPYQAPRSHARGMAPLRWTNGLLEVGVPLRPCQVPRILCSEAWAPPHKPHVHLWRSARPYRYSSPLACHARGLERQGRKFDGKKMCYILTWEDLVFDQLQDTNMYTIVTEVLMIQICPSRLLLCFLLYQVASQVFF